MSPSWNYATHVELSIFPQLPNQQHQRLPLQTMSFEFYWHLVVMNRHCTIGENSGLWCNTGLLGPGILGWAAVHSPLGADRQFVYRCRATQQWNTVQDFTITETVLPRGKIQTVDSEHKGWVRSTATHPPWTKFIPSTDCSQLLCKSHSLFFCLHFCWVWLNIGPSLCYLSHNQIYAAISFFCL